MNYFVGLIVLLLPSYLIRFEVLGIPTTLLEILIYVAAIITLVKFLIFNFKPCLPAGRFLISRSKFLILKQNKILIPMILFIMAGVISIFIAPDKREALGLFKAYILDPILFYFVLIMNIKTRKDVELIIKLLIISGFIISLHAIWQKFVGQVTSDNRVVGIFGYSPNYLALYLTPIAILVNTYELNIIGFANWRVFNWKLYAKIFPYEISFYIMFIAIWFSGSRAAIAVLILMVLVSFLVKYWEKIIKPSKIYKLSIYFSIVLLMLVAWMFVKPNWQLSSSEGSRITSSNNIRWEIWRTTVRDIIPIDNHWLIGVGLGNYQNYFTELTKDRINFPEWISPNALTPHNVFLNIWVNLGLLGLIAFVWILIIFFRSISSKNMAYRLSLIAMMIAIIAQGMVDSPYWKNDLAVLFWIILALSQIKFNQGDEVE